MGWLQKVKTFFDKYRIKEVPHKSEHCNHVYYFKHQTWVKISRKNYQLHNRSVCKHCKHERLELS